MATKTKTKKKFVFPQAKFTVSPDHTKDEHFYLIGDPYGMRVYSITGFLGYMGGPKVARIKGWAISQAAEYAYGLLLTENMINNPARAIQARTEIKRAPKQALDKTASFGTLVHDFAEKTARGLKPLMKDYDKELYPCIRAFKEWWKNEGLTPIAAELRVANPNIGYGGTLDLLAINKEGQIELIDFKTAGALHIDVQGQLAACNDGLFATYGIKADILRAVRIGREDHVVESRIVEDEAAAFEWFKGLVETKKRYEALVW